MKTKIIIILLLFTFSGAFAQERYIRIHKLNHKKEIKIYENKRIQFVTFDKQKMKGDFKIIDSEHISIDNKLVALSDIKKIKKKPPITSFLLDAASYAYGIILQYGGLVTYGMTGDPLCFSANVVGAGFIYLGASSHSLVYPYRSVKRGWKFEIVY